MFQISFSISFTFATRSTSKQIELTPQKAAEWHFKRKADNGAIGQVKVDLNIGDRVKMNPRGQGRILTNLGSPGSNNNHSH